MTDFRLQYERVILRESDLPPSARLLALALKSRADEDGHCFPSIELLARDTGMGERTVDKHLAVLRAGGYLRTQRRRTSSLYWIEIPETHHVRFSLSEAHHVPTRNARGADLETHGVRTEVENLKRSIEGDDDAVVAHPHEIEDQEELEQVLAPLGHLTRAQRAKAEIAWTESPEGVRAVARHALREGMRPAALFVRLLEEGAHLADEYQPTQPEPDPEPCDHCDGVFGHAVDCPHATGAAPTGVCSECGVGGGFHVDGCTLAAGSRGRRNGKPYGLTAADLAQRARELEAEGR